LEKKVLVGGPGFANFNSYLGPISIDPGKYNYREKDSKREKGPTEERLG